MDKAPAWRILLVDDDQEDFILTYSMLSASKIRKVLVDWRSSYASGILALAEGAAYDAALVDYELGGRSGIEFIREVRAKGCELPIILFSGRSSYELDMEATRAGASLYLSKTEANPLLIERLIRHAIEHTQTKQALLAAQKALAASSK